MPPLDMSVWRRQNYWMTGYPSTMSRVLSLDNGMDRPWRGQPSTELRICVAAERLWGSQMDFRTVSNNMLFRIDSRF